MPSGTPSESASLGQPLASTLAPAGVLGHLSRQSRTSAPPLLPLSVRWYGRRDPKWSGESPPRGRRLGRLPWGGLTTALALPMGGCRVVGAPALETVSSGWNTTSAWSPTRSPRK